MFERLPFLAMLASAAVVATMLAAPTVWAQKIVCWKDKSGKVIGCGDRVPPEFQQNEAKVLDSRGIVRETKVSGEESARQREAETKKAALKAEEDRRIAEQRRQDAALVNTYTSATEIDVRRDRELQVVDLQIQQLQAALKSSTEAQEAQQKRYDNVAKGGKPVPDGVKDELTRTTQEKARVEARIAERAKDKERINSSYAQQKARFLELKGNPATGSAPAETKAAPKK